jgi:hypothetical protein
MLCGFNDSGVDLFDTGNVFTLDTGYLYLQAGDEIDVHVQVIVQGDNVTANPLSPTLYIATGATVSFLNAIWDERNLWAGTGETISPVQYLPDIDTLEFLQGLKVMANLRFWMDRANRTIYIESSNDFYGSSIEDWRNKVDYSDQYDIEFIAASYNRHQILKWKADDSDKALTGSVPVGTDPLSKDFNLTNEYTSGGTDENENPVFSPTATGNMTQIGCFSLQMPRIFGNAEPVGIGKAYPAFRPKSWLPRLLTWEGLTVLGSGSFNLYIDYEDTAPVLYNSFPCAAAIDMSDMFDNYWLVDFNIIDKCRIVNTVVRLSPADLLRFITTMGTPSSEGFRARYKMNIEGIDMLFRVAKLTTDGERCRVEMIQIP